MADFPARLERFAEVDSTQRIVAAWLAAGTPEVAVAVADVQTAGRGRHGRHWEAPTGAALLCSCGFRPAWLAPRHAWRLGATVALAMLDAAEETAGLRDETLGLKWPNDLVVVVPAQDGSAESAAAVELAAAEPAAIAGPVSVATAARGAPAAGGAAQASGGTAPPTRGDALLKLGGVLGETSGTGERIATAVIGVGVDVHWAARDFPPAFAASMTSLSEVARRPVDREQLLDAFLARLEPRYEALRAGRFDAAGWSARQRTTDRVVGVALGDRSLEGLALGVDPDSGALLVEVDGVERSIDTGEVVRCRLRG